MRDTVKVQFDCGHRFSIAPDEYGDGSAWCPGCDDFRVYERCLTCHSVDCQALEGPTLPHGVPKWDYASPSVGGKDSQ